MALITDKQSWTHLADEKTLNNKMRLEKLIMEKNNPGLKVIVVNPKTLNYALNQKGSIAKLIAEEFGIPKISGGSDEKKQDAPADVSAGAE